MCLPLKPFKIEREWESSGLKCVVVQAREAAHRCGYVRVPPTHPAFGKGYDDVDVDVHGGLTFAEGEPCAHEDGSGWWLGFDCAHAGDAMTDMDVDRASVSADTKRLLEVYDRFPVRHEHYWTQPEVEAETERLAAQLAA